MSLIYVLIKLSRAEPSYSNFSVFQLKVRLSWDEKTSSYGRIHDILTIIKDTGRIDLHIDIPR